MNGAIPRSGFIVLMALAGCAGNPPYHTPTIRCGALPFGANRFLTGI